MASVLTDQFLPGSVIAPLVGLLTTPLIPQFNAASLTAKNVGRTGNATVLVPAPAVVGVYGARRYRFTVQGNVLTTAALNVGFNHFLVDTAGTSTIISTFSNAAVNTTTGAFVLVTEFILDQAAATISGQKYGWANQTINAATALTAAPTPVLTGSGQLQVGASFFISANAPTAVVTITEITLELL